MRGFRIVWRGLRDTLDHLFLFALLSIAWWACVVTVIGAPGASVTLFHLTDPRLGFDSDRPGARECFRRVYRSSKRAWALALLTLPVLALLAYNLWFYAGRESTLGFLLPVWLFFLVIGLCITLNAFSIAGMLEKSALESLRLATIVTGARLPHVVVVVLLLALIAFISRLLILPMIVLLPATVAAIVDRLVLDGLRLTIPDPHAPTDERISEKQQPRRG